MTAVATEQPAAAAITPGAIAAVAVISGWSFGAAAEGHQKNSSVHIIPPAS
jgi:hypothetical protein